MTSSVSTANATKPCSFFFLFLLPLFFQSTRGEFTSFAVNVFPYAILRYHEKDRNCNYEKTTCHYRRVRNIGKFLQVTEGKRKSQLSLKENFGQRNTESPVEKVSTDRREWMESVEFVEFVEFVAEARWELNRKLYKRWKVGNVTVAEGTLT